jgi:hypothetical protein
MAMIEHLQACLTLNATAAITRILYKWEEVGKMR